MDDIAEQQELANEISSAISSPMGFGHDIDEDDLLAELEGMEQEEMDKQVRYHLVLFFFIIWANFDSNFSGFLFYFWYFFISFFGIK